MRQNRETRDCRAHHAIHASFSCTLFYIVAVYNIKYDITVRRGVIFGHVKWVGINHVYAVCYYYGCLRRALNTSRKNRIFDPADQRIWSTEYATAAAARPTGRKLSVLDASLRV